MYCGYPQLGYANSSSVFFRHFLIDKNSTLNVTVSTLIGSPILLINLANNPMNPVSTDPTTYDVSVTQVDSNGNLVFVIDPIFRYN